MTNTCRQCAASIEPGWKVCPHCGAVLAATEEPRDDRSFSDRPQTVVAGGSTGVPSTPELATGPRYVVEAELGRGGMGVVHRARDTRLDRRVALKRLLTQGDDPHAVARFLTEARAVAALNHPNILTVYDVGEDEGGHYIAMELIDGISLDRLLERSSGKLPLDRAVQLFQGIAEGIAYAHRRNVIHRDIKPSNVLVTNDGTPKVVDFGLARQGLGSALSMTGFGMGTMDYAAPEQKRDAKAVDHRADVYSLGCTFYELLTGHAPPPHPDQIPEAYRAIVLKATHPEPADRYFSVQEMLDAVQRARGDAPSVPASTASSTPPSDIGTMARSFTQKVKETVQKAQSHVQAQLKTAKPAKPVGGGFLARIRATKWYSGVKPFHEDPGATEVPNPRRAAFWQLTGRGFRYLGYEPKRWAIYYFAGILMVLVFVAGAVDEFHDEEEFTSAFMPCFVTYVIGIFDVMRTARRIASGELNPDREA